MREDRGWTRAVVAMGLAIALPIGALVAVNDETGAAVAAPASTTVPATISASPSATATTLPAPIDPTPSPSATATTLPAPITPTAAPSTLPATLSPEELDARTSGNRYLVTFAARWCPEYSSVFANRARNNIMESLQDLGPNTNYASGEAINPGREDASPQSDCTPLRGWNFQLGDGIAGRTPGTNLSRVSNPGPVVTTTSSTPELSAAGNDTGRSIEGAVTLELTSQQVQAAANRQLWVQGGTATSPLGPVPGQYGFASLRCANDNLNGDNVEYVNFTTSQRHVFCYTYLVKPPPRAGVIIVKKAVPDVTAPDITFGFGGNVSFNPGGAFSLRKGQSIEFVRGASADTGFPWRVTEDVPPDWRLVIGCVSAKGTSTIDRVGTNGVDVDLAASDTVTCTFTNSPNPPPNRLELGKFAKNAAGTFGFTVRGPKGTLIDDSSVSVAADSLERIGSYELTAAGTYTVEESLPTSPKGTWQLTAVRCDGAVGTVDDDRTASIRIDDPSASGVTCVLVNTFESNGASLTIRSTTIGAPGGESTYEIAAAGGSSAGIEGARFQRADNIEADRFVTALPVTAADDTSDLDPQKYMIQGFGPVATVDGAWRLSDLVCAGGATSGRDLAGGTVTVTLPPRGQVVCDYVWTLVRPVTLDVVKSEVIAGGARTSEVRIGVACTNGAEGSLAVSPQEALPASMSPTMRFVESTVCRVSETAPGGNPVETSWRLTAPEGTTTGTGSYVDVRILHANNPGAAYQVVFTNTYRSGSPTTPPTAPPTEPPTEGGRPQEPVDPPTIPEVIDPETPTVVLPGEVETNAGRPARVAVTCRPLARMTVPGRVPSGDIRFCVVTKDRDGRVSVRVISPPVRVTLTLSAPATGAYEAYRFTKSWVVR